MKGRIEVQQFLDEIRKERGGLPQDLHVTRMCAGLVAVSNGQVIRVSDTKMRYCPLSSSFYDCLKAFHTCSLESKKKEIVTAVESKIAGFGHFTTRRSFIDAMWQFHLEPQK